MSAPFPAIRFNLERMATLNWHDPNRPDTRNAYERQCDEQLAAATAELAAAGGLAEVLAEALQTIICDNIKLADADPRPNQYAGRAMAAKTAARIGRLLAQVRPDKADFYNGTADAQTRKAAELDAKTAEWQRAALAAVQGGGK